MDEVGHRELLMSAESTSEEGGRWSTSSGKGHLCLTKRFPSHRVTQVSPSIITQFLLPVSVIPYDIRDTPQRVAQDMVKFRLGVIPFPPYYGGIIISAM